MRRLRTHLRRALPQLKHHVRAAAAGLAVLLAPTIVLGAAKPTPRPTPRLVVRPHIPVVPLHTEFNVEVNAKGQVVRVKSGKSCKDLTFNAQTYGNVLQMWVRRPDGTAIVGMYHVTYDFNPKTKRVARNVSLIKAGGNWGNEEGAANNMLDIARREAADAARKAPPTAAPAPLPGLEEITRTPAPSATHTP